MKGLARARLAGRPTVRSLAVLAPLALLLLLWGAPAPLAAQAVVGTVTDAESGQPVGGAFLVLQDEAGARRGATLSTQDGRYLLRAPAAGTYRLVVEMIGFQGATTPTFEVPAAGNVRQDVQLGVRAISLEGLTASAGERCRQRPGAGPETAALWEEARKALEISRWAEEQQVLRFQIEERRRELDGETLRVLAQETRPRAGWYDGSPYESIPLESLQARGYVQQAADGQYDYYAPDNEVLLSEDFLDRHCFRIVPPERTEDAHLVGLGFEPLGEPAHTDIRGVLWVDAGTAELERLDFHYVNLPFQGGEDWEEVGGRVEFERLATGVWVVRRWYVRMPLEAAVDRRTGRTALLRVGETGAEIQRVQTAEGALLSEAVGATLQGTVTDGAGPVDAAGVLVVGTEHTATTGPDGSFRFTELPDGRYRVLANTPVRVMIGLAPVEGTVDLVGGQTARLRIEAPLDLASARAFCEGSGWSGEEGTEPVLVYGRVEVPQGGAPAPSADIRLQHEGTDHATTADRDGSYRVCLTTSSQPALLAARPPGTLGRLQRLDPVRVDLASGGVVRADLRLPTTAEAQTSMNVSTRSSWSNALLGEVRDHETERPVENAMVQLLDATGTAVASALTDERGRFQITHPGDGEVWEVEVEHIGYATARNAVEFPEGQQVSVEVALAPEAIELEGITVTERRQTALVDAGFYDRQQSGGGGAVFVDREEIERRRPSKVTDVLRGRSNIQMMRAPRGSGEDIQVTGGARLSQGGSGFSACLPSVWIDGLKVRRGGGSGVNDGALLSDLISPENIAGLEVYTGAAGLPQQYGGSDAMCGVVLIWTRK